MRLRMLAHRIVRPLARLFDLVRIRIGRPPLTGEMYRRAIADMLPGDLILTRTALRPGNLFIPGHWSHVQIVTSVGGDTIEATMPVVRVSTMVDIWADASHVKIVRPLFATREQGVAAAAAAYGFIGIPYDTEFVQRDDAFYCSELAMRSYEVAGVSIPWSDLNISIAGVDTVTPSALDNNDLFETVFDSKK